MNPHSGPVMPKSNIDLSVGGGVRMGVITFNKPSSKDGINVGGPDSN